MQKEKKGNHPLPQLKVERSTSRIDKDLFGVYLYLLVTLFSVTSRVSCFLNAVLAVSRAIAVWKPFYRSVCVCVDRKSTRLISSHESQSRMTSYA